MIYWGWLLPAFLLGGAIGTAAAGWLACWVIIRVFELVERNDESLREMYQGKPPRGPITGLRRRGRWAPGADGAGVVAEPRAAAGVAVLPRQAFYLRLLACREPSGHRGFDEWAHNRRTNNKTRDELPERFYLLAS